MLPTTCKNFRLIAQKLRSARISYSAKILLTFDIFKDFFDLFRFISKQICLFLLSLYTFLVCLVHFETNLFVSVVSMYIFGMFWFILKQNCFFSCFEIHLKHRNKPKQDFHWFWKWTKNTKQILFRLFLVLTKNLFYLFRGHPYHDSRSSVAH